MIRTYSELIKFKTFDERFNYLKLNGIVGEATFGRDRYLNQMLYMSPMWKQTRSKIILRDNACDLGVDGYDIHTRIIIHHMNPITIDDILARSEDLYNPEFLITVTHTTHNAIHYGDASLLLSIAERKPNDTKLW